MVLLGILFTGNTAVSGILDTHNPKISVDTESATNYTNFTNQEPVFRVIREICGENLEKTYGTKHAHT
jgi:hypothetical protein